MAGHVQVAALRFIETFRAEHGRAPNSTELGVGLRIRNRGKGVQIYWKLDQKGYIQRTSRDVHSSYETSVVTAAGSALLLRAEAVARHRSPAARIARVSRPLNLVTKRIAPASIAGTVYPDKVRDPGMRVLSSGQDSAKLGRKVTKTRWRGMPIYYLTLEERATCPATCAHWPDCYGNNMHLAVRFRHGPALEAAIERDLASLAAAHPRGFVVRLHMLGDFYSPEYVHLWRSWLARYPQLRVFGYTAWPRETETGFAVYATNVAFRERFVIRRSGAAGGRLAARTIGYLPDRVRQKDGLVCPHQLGLTQSCGTCGLCWSAPDKTILFVDHAFLKKRIGIDDDRKAA